MCDLNPVLKEIREVKKGLVDLEVVINKIEVEIKNEMHLKHQAIKFEHLDHEKRLSSTEKIIVFIASAIGLALIGAFLKLVIL